MHFDLDFGEPREIDGVTLDCAHDQWSLGLELAGQDAAGRWKTLSTSPRQSENAPLPDLRRAAVREIVARGITHLLLRDSDFGAADFRDRAHDWGIRLIGETEGWQLYALN
jgi:hypothetical protein